MIYVLGIILAIVVVKMFVMNIDQRDIINKQDEIIAKQIELSDNIEKLTEAQSFESYRNIVLTNNYISEQLRELDREGYGKHS